MSVKAQSAKAQPNKGYELHKSRRDSEKIVGNNTL